MYREVPRWGGDKVGRVSGRVSALGEPPPSLPLLIMQSLLGSWKGAQGPYRVGGEILNVLLLEEDAERGSV